MTEDPDLLVERRDDGVILLTLNRPSARNAVSFAMWERFGDALTDLENDTPPRAVILRGAGNFFGSGGDVKTPPARGSGALALAARLELGQRVIARLHNLPVPTIAAIEGGAFGVSWSLALACDMIFAGTSARFGMPFLDFGLVPDGGAAWFLTRRLGRFRAAEIIYSGRTLDAAEALTLGLLSRSVPDGTAVDHALAFAGAIGDGNRHAVELTKRLIAQAEDGTLAATQALELAYCHTCQSGDEVKVARERFAARARARTAKA